MPLPVAVNGPVIITSLCVFAVIVPLAKVNVASLCVFLPLNEYSSKKSPEDREKPVEVKAPVFTFPPTDALIENVTCEFALLVNFLYFTSTAPGKDLINSS